MALHCRLRTPDCGQRLTVVYDHQFIDTGLSRHAAVCLASCTTGNTQVTVVPCPSVESIVTVPPCNSTKERTSDSPKPVPRCSEPIESVSNHSNTLSLWSGGMPGPRSVTVNTTASGRRSADSVTVPSGGEKPTALAS